MRQTNSHRTQRLNPGHALRGGTRVKGAAVLNPGQLRCPVCRNGATPTAAGYLRKHRDLFGLTCYNRRPPEASA